MKSLLLMSAVLIAAPAAAQSNAAPATTPPPSTNAAQTTPPAQPVTDAPVATDASPAPGEMTTEPTSATDPAQPAANPADAVAMAVANDWAKYDTDSNGNLSKAEFSAWMTALRTESPAQQAQVTDVNAWTTAAFAQADADKSGSVTKPELEGFLKG